MVYKVLHDIHLVWGNVVERNCAVAAACHSLFHRVINIPVIFQYLCESNVKTSKLCEFNIDRVSLDLFAYFLYQKSSGICPAIR